MFKADEILGMNARNQLYVSQNSGQARQFCHSKLAAKTLLQDKGIAVAKIHQIMVTDEEIDEYDWNQLKSNFVVKPTNGSGGKGILVFRKQVKPGVWDDVVGVTWTKEKIILHCRDILAGKYSTHAAVNNGILVEERVPIHPLFLKFSYGGTPDLRVIVYNSVPVMAMLRLPTKESEGRANLHQGAIGAGIDLSTGVTIHAITSSGIAIKYIPGTKRKLHGIKIPFWRQTLLTAVQAANAAGLTYGGIDLFLHKELGPLVVEMNTHPGLSIQLANQKGLKKRLERVNGLNVFSLEHGVKIAQTLFASELTGKIDDQEEKVIISQEEEVVIYGRAKQRKAVPARVYTSYFRSSISWQLAEELNLFNPEDMLWVQNDESGKKNPVITITFSLKGRRVATTMVVSKLLDKGRIKVRLGRNDLANFLVGVSNK